MKKCSKCKNLLNKNEFNKNKATKDGFEAWCKSCRKTYNKLRYEKNKEKMLVWQKQYYKTNKNKLALTHKISAHNCYIKHKSGIKCKFRTYKADAKKRKLCFDLAFVEFVSFWQQPCTYCGSKIKTIGIDRKNNKLGYSISNCTSCCTICNYAKNNIDYKEWQSYLRQIVNYRKYNLSRIVERVLSRKRYFKEFYNGLIRGAQTRQICFNLTFDQFLTFNDLPCKYCGTITKNNIGIDRVNNTIGYLIENCVSCCKNCNLGKHDFTDEQWGNWLSNVVRFNDVGDL